MKFESGFERKERDDRKAGGEKLTDLDAYKDLNSESVEELLEKRLKEQEELALRQKQRIEMLEKLEKEGILYIDE